MSDLASDLARADAYHRLALLHDRQGDCQTATEYYQQALERNSENSELHCDIGYSQYLQQRWQEAESSLRRAIALTPDLGRAHNNLGLVLARTGREQESLEEFARAGCDQADAHANLAHAMMLSNRWNEEQIEFRRALDTNPDLPAARDGLRSLRSLMAKQDANAPRSHQPAASRLPILATYTEPIQEVRPSAEPRPQ